MRRNKNSGIYSSGSVVLPEFSWPGTEKPREPRALPSSALRTGATPHVPATRWMDVRFFPSPYISLLTRKSLIILITISSDADFSLLQSVTATSFFASNSQRGPLRFFLHFLRRIISYYLWGLFLLRSGFTTLFCRSTLACLGRLDDSIHTLASRVPFSQ